MSNFSFRDAFLHSNLLNFSSKPDNSPHFESYLKDRSQTTPIHSSSLQAQMQALGINEEEQEPFNRKSSIKTDRFIPSRKSSKLQIFFTNAHSELYGNENENPKGQNSTNPIETEPTSSNHPQPIRGENEGQNALIELYRNQVLGIQNYPENTEKFKNKNLLRFTEENIMKGDIFHQKKCERNGLNYYENLISCTNMIFRENSPSLCEKKPMRKIAKTPFKILDAPNLQDDYYLNLIDWSGQDVLAVALGSCVYLWSAINNKVSKLCELPEQVTSVAWSPKGYFLSVGVNDGEIQIWDSIKAKKVNSFADQHTARVGALGWSNQILCSGSRDKTIVMRDIRMDGYIRKLIEHKQEVCGIKWSFDEQQVASGGNDNKLLVWSIHSSSPVRKFLSHTAAVKAIAWSPHQHGLLASGGGTADRTIRFWNTLENTQIHLIDTDSQVCNLIFAKNVNEFVSTHGYSMNQIILWKYPAMEKVTTLTGHTSRVLYLAMSPDGENIVSGAGDETLRFWNIFPKNNAGSGNRSSVLIGDAKELR